MGNWYVVDDFGNTIAGPFIDKNAAESVASGSSQFSVVYH
jgi:hypothetical protein